MIGQIAGTALALGATAVGYVAWKKARARGLDRWLPGYIASTGSRRHPPKNQPIHVFLCIADHYEPKGGKATNAKALSRVSRWVEEYPRQFGQFRDADGMPPRHSFFYPCEEYETELLDGVSELVRQGFGEVEIHLHHDNDSPDNLRRTLCEFRDRLVERHQLLARHPETGQPGYAFIHGNWALNNSRADGRFCGINDEIPILRETGCYLDMTNPAYPSTCQTQRINSIYYAKSSPDRPRGHDDGPPATASPPPSDSLLMIQGPLLLDWNRRKFGLIPRVENDCLQGNQPPTMDRLDTWLRARIQVPTRPDWYFVKLHAHGCDDKNIDMMLGEPMVRFHEALAERSSRDPNFHFHYVTAREMANLALAAQQNWRDSAENARKFFWQQSPIAPTYCEKKDGFGTIAGLT